MSAAAQCQLGADAALATLLSHTPIEGCGVMGGGRAQGWGARRVRRNQAARVPAGTGRACTQGELAPPSARGTRVPQEGDGLGHEPAPGAWLCRHREPGRSSVELSLLQPGR